MSAQETLAPLLANGQVWRGGTAARLQTQSTGYPGLDALLPGGGWPCGAISEILMPSAGCGEVQLVLPWLARLTTAGGRAAIVRPPLLPYAPALAAAGVVLSRLLVINPEDARAGAWAMTEMLRSGGFSAVLGWPGVLQAHDLKRLQIAAENGGGAGILYRDSREATQPSQAALRLQLEGHHPHFTVQVLKCRGGAAGGRWQHAA